MPLDKNPSRRALKHNIEVEYNSLKAEGKSDAKASKQAYAIAKSVQRRSRNG